MKSILRTALAALAAFTLITVTGHAAAGTITEFAVPTVNSGPNGIGTGPDGNIWFTEYRGNNIGRITTSGSVTEFPSPSGSLQLIAAGPDGNLWFTRSSEVGQIIATTGSITTFSTGLTPGSRPFGITAGSDGNLWFAEYSGNKIGRITTSGSITEFSVPTVGGYPNEITAGSDGNLWFVEDLGNMIGRITTSGSFTEFTIPTTGSRPYGIARGADGNLWFTEASANKIGRITASGSFTEFPVPTAKSTPLGIAAGPDGNLWFTENDGNQIGRITTSGSITEFPVTTGSSAPEEITAGPDGNVWFTEYSGNKVGRITAGFQPDTRLGVNAAIPVGDNIYNLTAAGQTLNALVRHGGGVKTVIIGIQNDAPFPASFTVYGAPGNAKFAVKYLYGRANVTYAVTHGTFSTGTLAPGAVCLLRAQITAKTPLARQIRSLYIISTSATDTNAKDCALIKAKSN